ncbi:MAG: Fic family protein [Rickettsia sp.]|nr:Fic family protein [Rickettsia sp.]
MSHINSRLEKPYILSNEVYRLILEIDSYSKSLQILKRNFIGMNLNKARVIILSTSSAGRMDNIQLNNKEVKRLYYKKNSHNCVLKSKDDKAVYSYMNILEKIFVEFNNMSIQESTILQIHKDALMFSVQDFSLLGNYRKNINLMDKADGNSQNAKADLVSQQMLELINWFNWANKKYNSSLVIANFIFEFLSIQPFQEGNIRMSMLLTHLMLLKVGHFFSLINSYENLIEKYQQQYQDALEQSQKNLKTDQENIQPWVMFFLTILREQAQKSIEFYEKHNCHEIGLSNKQEIIFKCFKDNQKEYLTRKNILEETKLNHRTVEASLKKLFTLELITRWGAGRGVRYKYNVID